MKNRRASIRAVKFVVALVGALLFFAPFTLVIFNSVKPLDQIMTDLLGLPRTVQLGNYLNAWEELNMGKVMLNTILVTGISLVLILMLSSMVAYWTVRHPSRYSRLFEKLLVCSLLIPFAAVMLSLVKTMSALHLTSSLWGGIITYSGMDEKTLQSIQNMVNQYCPFEKIYLQKASSAIASNCGANSFGLLFMRRDDAAVPFFHTPEREEEES